MYRANRLIERGLMCLTIVGVLAIVITLLTMQSPKASAVRFSQLAFLLPIPLPNSHAVTLTP